MVPAWEARAVRALGRAITHAIRVGLKIDEAGAFAMRIYESYR